MNIDLKHFISKALDLILTFILCSVLSLCFAPISKTVCSCLTINYRQYYSLFVEAIIFIIIPIIIWKVIKEKPLSEMGLPSFKKNIPHFLTGLVLGAVSTFICFLLVRIFGSSPIHVDTSFNLKDFFISFILFTLLGFGEEILIRGYAFSTISDGSKKSKLLALYTTSLFFASMFLNSKAITITAFINMFLLGLLYGYMYYCTNSIWMSIGCHITWSFFEGVVFGFNICGNNITGILTSSVSYENIFNGGNFGLEGTLFCTMVLILQLIFVNRKCRS